MMLLNWNLISCQKCLRFLFHRRKTQTKDSEIFMASQVQYEGFCSTYKEKENSVLVLVFSFVVYLSFMVKQNMVELKELDKLFTAAC